MVFLKIGDRLIILDCNVLFIFEVLAQEYIEFGNFFLIILDILLMDRIDFLNNNRTHHRSVDW